MQLSTSDLLSIASVIIGIIVSYYFYRKSLSHKEPTVAYKHNNIITNQISLVEDLTMLYKQQEIKNLTISRVMFWNNGTNPIRREDIATNDPIKIALSKNALVLDAKIVSVSSKVNEFNCKVTDDKKSVLLDFYFLGYKQGAIIQVVHTDAMNQLTVTGTIIGGEPIRERVESKMERISAEPEPRRLVRVENPRPWLSSFLLFWGVIVLFPGIVFSIPYFSNPLRIAEDIARGTNQGLIYGLITSTMLGPGFLLIGIFMIYIAYRIWRNRPPNGLESFDK